MRRWVIACLVLALCLPLGCAGAVQEGYTVFNGSREEPRIAITVDDCYDINHVTEVLDLCEAHGVPVTFFVVGKALREEDAEVWLRALDLGCEIGNHTWDHVSLPRETDEDIISQLDRVEVKLDKVLGKHYEMQMMRPPYGKLTLDPERRSDKRVVRAIEAAGYVHAVRWDVSETDAKKASWKVKNGSILLYHANLADVACLVELIPVLLEKGFEPVTVSELLGYEKPILEEIEQ